MKKQPLRKTIPVTELRADKVLTRWLVAVSTLQENYIQLRKYTSVNDDQQQPLLIPKRIGQCTSHQLMIALDKLQNELAVLLQDIKQADQPGGYHDGFEKLSNHTLKLEELNQQVQVLLRLAALPAS